MMAGAIASVAAHPVLVPLPAPHRTASGTIDAAPLVVVGVRTSSGTEGHSYIFAYTPLLLAGLAEIVHQLGALLVGHPLAPFDRTGALEARLRLAGKQGLAAMAVAGLDMAMWDALARAMALPLASLLGGAPGPVPVYDSLGQMSPDEAAQAVETSLAAGFRAVKIKAGSPDVATDVATLKAMRRVAGSDLPIMIDFNQAFAVDDAIRRIDRIETEVALTWIEEPTRAEDEVGHAQIAAAARTPIQLGENWWGLIDMRRAIEANASDVVMPDAIKIGGVTGWLGARALAEAAGLRLSSHLYGEASAHLMAVTPTAHFIEWFDVAGAVNLERPRIHDGRLLPFDGPGSGFRPDPDALDRFAH